jgi:hypothetical protein
MRVALTLVAAGCIALLDLALFANVRVFDSHPSGAVAAVAVWCVLRRRDEAMLLAPAAGLFLGLLGNEPLGASVLGLAPTVLLAVRRAPPAADGRFLTTLEAAAAGSALYSLTLAVLVALLRQVPLAPVALARQMITSGLLTALVAAVLYWPMAHVAWQARLPGRFQRS